jgi:ABC-type molybdate transport system substrate-binding protein
MAVIRASRQVVEIRKFAAFLTTSEAAGVFASYGFMPLQGKR